MELYDRIQHQHEIEVTNVQYNGEINILGSRVVEVAIKATPETFNYSLVVQLNSKYPHNRTISRTAALLRN